MSVVNVAKSSLQLNTAVEVTNVTTALESRNRKIEHEFAGLWKLFIEFPNLNTRGRPLDTGTHLRIYVAPSYTPRMDYRHLGMVTVTLSLESLRAEVQQTTSYEWDLTTDQNLVEERWINMNWAQLWTDNQDIQADNGFRVVISLSSVPAPTRPVVTHQLLLNNILDLMQGQDIIDTKFLVYSKRRVVDGVVQAYDPLPVYANSHLLRSQCEYFDDLLGNPSYTESQFRDFDQPPENVLIEEYADDTDSDLGYVSGEDEDQIETPGGDADDFLDGEPISARSIRSVRSSSRPRTSWANLSDDSLPDFDPPDAQDAQNTVVGDHDDDDGDDGDESGDDERWSGSELRRQHTRHHNRFGKVVNIEDFSYVTWKALIFYLCTSQIEFAPLKVSGMPRARSQSERSQGLPSRPSAKSIYRAADKLHLEDLTRKALDHIKSQLTTEVVVRELFSKFTSRHEAVRNAEFDFVFAHWDELKTSDELRDMLRRVANGEMPHADIVLATLVAH